MKIVDIETKIVSLELKTPFKTALRTATHVEFVRVKAACEDGSFAYGEAPATKAVTGEGIEEILAGISHAKDGLLFHMPKEAIDILHGMGGIGSSAKAALDMAFIRLDAIQSGRTLEEYFGITDKSAIQSAITISYNGVDEMLRDAALACEDGMSILKLKVGGDISHAISITTRVLEEFSHAKILVDANQAWGLEESLYFCKAMQDSAIELIEQPVKANEISALKEIKEVSNIPILADESVFTLEDAKRVVESGSADMINIKLMKCGGVTKAIEILEYARAEGVKCMLGSMLEGPHSINAALYLAFAYRDVIGYIDLDSPMLLKELPNELEFTYRGSWIEPRF